MVIVACVVPDRRILRLRPISLAARLTEELGFYKQFIFLDFNRPNWAFPFFPSSRPKHVSSTFWKYLRILIWCHRRQCFNGVIPKLCATSRYPFIPFHRGPSQNMVIFIFFMVIKLTWVSRRILGFRHFFSNYFSSIRSYRASVTYYIQLGLHRNDVLYCSHLKRVSWSSRVLKYLTGPPGRLIGSI